MPKKNIYLPRDLIHALAERRDINVSAVCQAALRKALDPEISTEALIASVERAVAETAETLLNPSTVQVSYIQPSVLRLQVQTLVDQGMEIISITYVGDDGVFCVIYQ